ncbi:MAG TPA: trigger factor [Candidatus Paceibacterota bacterium]|nr:trigger factor [Candidatus Paceibacterota bacterium]
MNVSSKHTKPYTLEATIELDAAELNAYVEHVSGAMAGSVTVPGFRKGKAPKDRAEQALDDAAVREEALQHALEESFTKAVAQEGWDVAGTADLSIKRNDNAGLAYAVSVQLWPPVTLPDLATIKVPRKEVTIADAEIDETIETVRGLRATFLEKTGTATEGDRVEVDFDATLDGKPLEGGSSRNHPLIIGGKSFMPGFEEHLIGLAVGMEKQFTLTAPADYYEPKLADKEVVFKVTMRRVQAVLKPAIDDAFAKTAGSFADLAALRTSIADGLRREKEDKEHQRLQLAILDAIAGAAKPETPDFMIDRELNDMLARFGRDLQQRGMALPIYLARMNTTEEKVKEGWRKDAERQVRITLVLRQLAKDRNVQASSDEIDTTAQAAIAELVKQGQEAEQIDVSQLRGVIAERIVRDRLLALVERECAIA